MNQDHTGHVSYVLHSSAGNNPIFLYLLLEFKHVADSSGETIKKSKCLIKQTINELHVAPERSNSVLSCASGLEDPVCSWAFILEWKHHHIDDEVNRQRRESCAKERLPD